jgi:hypothetical protein
MRNNSIKKDAKGCKADFILQFTGLFSSIKIIMRPLLKAFQQKKRNRFYEKLLVKERVNYDYEKLSGNN